MYSFSGGVRIHTTRAGRIGLFIYVYTACMGADDLLSNGIILAHKCIFWDNDRYGFNGAVGRFVEVCVEEKAAFLGCI